MLGPVVPETSQHHAPPASKPRKTEGSIGEELEGDVSTFKLLSIGPCKGAPHPTDAAEAKDPKARAVVAARVEVVAKTKLQVSPRDLSLRKPGMSFMSSVDPKREVEGCTPLLKVSALASTESAKGYVLFDLPAWGPGSDVKDLDLVYHPARFGGSIPLRVELGVE